MACLLSCGIVVLNERDEIFLCHATGTSRWDLPKGLSEPGESPLQTALRETWEETSLMLEAEMLHDLGPHAYLPSKRLHLFALRVSAEAFQLSDCCCRSTFAHRITGVQTPEVDAYAWKPRSLLQDYCAKNMSRVLLSLDWSLIESLPIHDFIRTTQ